CCPFRNADAQKTQMVRGGDVKSPPLWSRSAGTLEIGFLPSDLRFNRLLNSLRLILGDRNAVKVGTARRNIILGRNHTAKTSRDSHRHAFYLVPVLVMANDCLTNAAISELDHLEVEGELVDLAIIRKVSGGITAVGIAGDEDIGHLVLEVHFLGIANEL